MNNLMRGLSLGLLLLAFSAAPAAVRPNNFPAQTTGAATAIPPIFDHKNAATTDVLLPGFLERKTPLGFVRSKRMERRRKGRGALLTIVTLLLVIVILVVLL